MLALGFILMQGGVGRLKVFVAKLIYVSWDAVPAAFPKETIPSYYNFSLLDELQMESIEIKMR